MSLYKRFCQLDRNSKGFISTDEFLSVPELAMNPLSQVVIKDDLIDYLLGSNVVLCTNIVSYSSSRV